MHGPGLPPLLAIIAAVVGGVLLFTSRRWYGPLVGTLSFLAGAATAGLIAWPVAAAFDVPYAPLVVGAAAVLGGLLNLWWVRHLERVTTAVSFGVLAWAGALLALPSLPHWPFHALHVVVGLIGAIAGALLHRRARWTWPTLVGAFLVGAAIASATGRTVGPFPAPGFWMGVSLAAFLAGMWFQALAFRSKPARPPHVARPKPKAPAEERLAAFEPVGSPSMARAGTAPATAPAQGAPRWRVRIHGGALDVWEE